MPGIGRYRPPSRRTAGQSNAQGALFMLISEAYAQAGGGTNDMLTSLLPLVLIFVVFYFLLIRPQQKKMKDHKAMIEAVRSGDTVTTYGGICDKVPNAQCARETC